MEPDFLVAILVPIAAMAMIFGIVYLAKKENCSYHGFHVAHTAVKGARLESGNQAARRASQ